MAFAERGVSEAIRGLMAAPAKKPTSMEEWEELWADYQGPDRQFFQGLIQAAVCLHHFGNGNTRGAKKLAGTDGRDAKSSADIRDATHDAPCLHRESTTPSSF